VFAGTDVLRANIRGARWNPPDVETIYGSLSPTTATAEVDYLISRQPVPIRKTRVTHELTVTLRSVVDFRDLSPLRRLDIAPEMVLGADLSTPQLIGEAAAWLQCTGLLVPSARDKGVNIVIFVSNMTPTDTLEPISQEPHVAG
jgi:RES domain-containing protein